MRLSRHYGSDLVDYIHSEFAGPAPDTAKEPPAKVAFWRDFVG